MLFQCIEIDMLYRTGNIVQGDSIAMNNGGLDVLMVKLQAVLQLPVLDIQDI